MKHRQWLTVTAKIEVCFNRIYGSKGPVLNAAEVQSAEKPGKEMATSY